MQILEHILKIRRQQQNRDFRNLFAKQGFSQNRERPKSVFKISSFLGLAGYYRRFIEDLSRLVAPMTRLTWKEVKLEWNDICEKAFQEL